MTETHEADRRAARAIVVEYFGDEEDRPVWTTRDGMVEILVQAILAEREMCAKIAEANGWQGEISEGVKASRPYYEQGEKDTADEIAAAIRRGDAP